MSLAGRGQAIKYPIRKAYICRKLVLIHWPKKIAQTPERVPIICQGIPGGTFFPVVLLFQFFVLAGNRFWFYILHLPGIGNFTSSYMQIRQNILPISEI